jgi:hypothetical protein
VIGIDRLQALRHADRRLLERIDVFVHFTSPFAALILCQISHSSRGG